jgi:hypothetical protein
MARYTYSARDLRTGEFLGELPLGDVRIRDRLNGAGDLSAVIDLSARSRPQRVATFVDNPFVESDGGYTLTDPSLVTESSSGGYVET